MEGVLGRSLLGQEARDAREEPGGEEEVADASMDAHRCGAKLAGCAAACGRGALEGLTDLEVGQPSFGTRLKGSIAVSRVPVCPMVSRFNLPPAL